jgi:hypothetical protein
MGTVAGAELCKVMFILHAVALLACPEVEKIKRAHSSTLLSEYSPERLFFVRIASRLRLMAIAVASGPTLECWSWREEDICLFLYRLMREEYSRFAPASWPLLSSKWHPAIGAAAANLRKRDTACFRLQLHWSLHKNGNDVVRFCIAMSVQCQNNHMEVWTVAT